jgi:hypothetical protein
MWNCPLDSYEDQAHAWASYKVSFCDGTFNLGQMEIRGELNCLKLS